MSTETATTTDPSELSNEELTRRVLAMCGEDNPMKEHLEAALQREEGES